MCWFSKTKNIKIAENDISVIKFVKRNKSIHNNIVYSYYTNKKYVRNSHNKKIPLCIDFDSEGFVVKQGYHSYDINIQILTTPNNGYNNSMTFIYPPSYDLYDENFLDCFLTKDIEQVNCIIPKGTKYYLNNNGEYVSETIIVL